MTLAKHLEEAAGRLEEARLRLMAAREGPSTPESQREWLEALTEYALALTELHEYTNEALYEKLAPLEPPSRRRRGAPPSEKA